MLLERCLRAHQVRQIQRTFRHAKLTILYLFMTILVLRGVVGAGKFGTPQKDFNELQNHLFYASRKHAEPHRVPEKDSSSPTFTLDEDKLRERERKRARVSTIN